jgi:predicted cation transporter
MLTIRKSGVAVAWLICSAVMARAQTPTIVSAIVNSATKQITITGTSLTATGAPVVKLDSTTLALVSSASTQIVANLPAGLAAGTYRMMFSAWFRAKHVYFSFPGPLLPAFPLYPNRAGAGKSAKTARC